MPRPDTTLRTLATAARVSVILTVVLGVLYPALVTGIATIGFADRAEGSLLRDASGQVVGSRLIGQSFTDADGAPIPSYFQPRPSAADHDALASGGSNLGPESPELIETIRARRRAIAAFNDVDPAAVPPDALTASGSGLDPEISPAYADLQVERIARARGLAAERLRDLVTDHTRGRAWGLLGEPRVNVLELNLALDRLSRS